MRIDILTVLPEMIDGMINCSIVKRAQDKGLVEIHLINLRDYTSNKWRRVDDYPFGGEAGMVMQIEPIDKAISALKSERDYDEVIYTSPDGEIFNQPMANSMNHIPHFSLTKRIMTFLSQFIVRMNLNGQISTRINKLDQQGKTRTKLFHHLFSYQLFAICMNQFV